MAVETNQLESLILARTRRVVVTGEPGPAVVTMAEVRVLCDFCQTARPVGETYQSAPSCVVHRCRDTAACQRREVDSLYLTAHRDNFPSVALATSAAITPAPQRHARTADARSPVPGARPRACSTPRGAPAVRPPNNRSGVQVIRVECLDRFPSPAVVVLTEDLSAVSGHTVGATI
jgi:hypothetical protein